MQPGYQFGFSQGVPELTKDVSLTFFQTPHTLRLFSTRELSILKKEKALIVRTPAEFEYWYWLIAGGFLAGFVFLHLLLSIWFRQVDQLLVPVVMLLTGLSMITLLSLQDPLRDRFLAKDMLLYFGIGVLGIGVMLFINLRKFTVDSVLYRLFIFKGSRQAANGWPWAVVAMALLTATILFGTGPEGSGVRVNLFGFQPSEFVKYAILLFLAGFFATNSTFIGEYRRWQKRWSFFWFALLAIVLSIFLFLILGDLGPSMVVCFTFIILFSFSRGDFVFMVGAVVFYILANWLLANPWLATGLTAAGLLVLALLPKKYLSESAVMALVVMAGFLLVDQIPLLDRLFPGPVQRLVERKAIWLDAWNNEVYGGDQVANGIWAMAGGGLTGQGLGEGFSRTIPAAHTDMVLPAIGEVFGGAGIVCVFILFLIYLHRSFIIGRQTGTPFLFYLCTGIGISTFIQFLLIAGGSTGALPLSGVALPFISYGGSSLVANFLAAGFMLSASRVQGTAVQMSYIANQQDKHIVPALIAACVGIGLLIANVSPYVVDRQKWVVQPALVADRSGARMFSYNPRIGILMNKLQAGSLYDRAGHILATGSPNLIRKQQPLAGSPAYNLDSAVRKRLERYYPLGDQLFFWVGDANTDIFRGGNNGYFAEYQHAAELRGFGSPVTTFPVVSTRYREDRFLPRGVREMTVSRYDYSALTPLLLAGINSPQVEAFKKRNRDVQLTLDAELQIQIQQSVARDTSLRDNRVSVVVMEAASGDVLTSAVYPLPPTSDEEQLTMTPVEQNSLPRWVTTADLGFTYATQPGSTAKVLTALAAFNKLGLAASQKTFAVRGYERIRTGGGEPDETGLINLERGLVKSNNVYFIKLANEAKLQEEMAQLYLKTGMFLHGVGGYYYEHPNRAEQEDKWLDLWRKTEFNTKPRYNPGNIRRTRARGISGMAWGQGELIATPAAVTRLASGVANGGVLMPSRYVLSVGGVRQPPKKGIQVAADPQYAQLLTGYMIKQSANRATELSIAVAGKTGTPERIWKGKRINDGWYVFFAPTPTGSGHTVVCVRIESTKGSRDAVRLAGKHVIPFLQQKGYIKSFGPDVPEPVGPPVATNNTVAGHPR
jgi:cell division protein FtsW (lipid II flippase)